MAKSTITADGRKVCCTCKEPKALSEFRRLGNQFTVSGERRIASYCRECDRARSSADYQKYKDKYIARAKRYFSAHPEKVRIYRANGNRRRSLDPSKRAASAALRKAWHARIKAEMFDAYGHKCACCGEAEIEFLTLEHTRGDGKAHRKAVGASRVYFDLKKRGWPTEGYAILCMNCNFASRGGRTCPHARARVKEAA